ncbi:glycosyltransferase family 39 protein [Gammaproteobacteria bacterium]|nr:glycosyltransferase family 39 protein [Gammaproteobacteria bacterium]
MVIENKIPSKKYTALIIFSLFLFSLIYRLPFWFIDVMNWDESTFMLMGQSILDRKLLYSDLWDLKPPLAFLSVSAIMALLGESIFSMRFLGVLSVFLSSTIIYFINRKFFSFYLTLFLSFLSIPMMTIYFSGQSTTTEHLAMPFSLLSLYISIDKKNLSIKRAAIVGLLISLASMIRLNLAYISIPIGIIVLIYSNRFSIPGRLIVGLAYAVGGLLPIFFLISFYAYYGELQLLYNSLILAPFTYSIEQKSIFDSLLIHTYDFIKLDGSLYVSFKFIMFFTALLGFIFSLLNLNKNKDHKRIKLLVFSLSLIFSVLATGGAFRHYLIQLSPIIVIYSGFFLNKLNDFRFANYLFIPMMILFLILDSEDEMSQYKSLYLAINNQVPLNNGYGYWAEEEINNLDLCDYSLYAMSHHIVYFLLDKKPPIPIVTHPSNLTKDYVIKALYGEKASPKSELEKIIQKEPTIILKPKKVWYLKQYPMLENDLQSFLKQYSIHAEKDWVQIYIRNDALANSELCM